MDPAPGNLDRVARRVIGVDSSTQSCTVVVVDDETGQVLRHGSVPHPDGTEVDPGHWRRALDSALAAVGGLDADVVAMGIAAQQHGMVALDADGAVVRPALLWNDTRSAGAAANLAAELGAAEWADATGSVPLASFTVSKLRWMAEHEPAAAARVAAVCLPHDWLTWSVRGAASLSALSTDRGDASGTGYWSPRAGSYCPELVELAFGRPLAVPTVLEPWTVAGEMRPGMVVSAGTGDNMAAALGLRAEPGEVVMSIGTSGVVSAVSDAPTSDPTGTIAGFADATGRFLPLVCTLNGARVLTSVARMIGCDLERLSDLALSAPPGAEGLVLVPYFDGERTPNLPDARGRLFGMSSENTTQANVARAAVEGIVCGLADGVDALVAAGVDVRTVVLVGGATRSTAVQQIAAAVIEADVRAAHPAEHAALGAAWQAARAAQGGSPPGWPPPAARGVSGPATPSVRARYREAAEQVAAVSGRP